MNRVKGTTGYPEAVERFIEATMAIGFVELHRPFIDFIPVKPGRVLDVGAGIGRDSSVISGMGHSVVAIEPTADFRVAARRLFDSPGIQWVDDSLPDLHSIGDPSAGFDFVLASAVWHHLNKAEQQTAMERISSLLNPDGIFALSLRHGPAGVGTHIFPTDGQRTINAARDLGLKTLLHLRNQPSLMKGKKKVTWTRLVFAKQEL